MDITKRGAQERNVLIVGAGPGGLAAAILLAAAGVRVRIIERLPIVAYASSNAGGVTSRLVRVLSFISD